MQKDRYLVNTDSNHKTYEFLSSGPNGTVKKVVQYTKISRNVYNLGFGDWSEEAQQIRDDVRTNNNDREKVLATVALTVIDFLKHHPASIIVAIGNTPAKMRLYQISLTKIYPEVKDFLMIRGYSGERWQPFEPGETYFALSVKAK